ncbi:MAG: ABC transporter substrate-binding protein [Alphaproteobacteria bacterium]
MKRRLAAIASAAVLCLAGGAAQAETEIKIGFLNTFTGPGAAVGTDMKNSWDIALEHLGGKLGGLKPTVLVGDDLTKPEVALTVVDKWLKQDKVDFVVGVIWSNVLLAIKDPIFQAGKILINPNAGATPIAAEQCHPQHFSTSSSNEQWSEATGEMANLDGIKNVFILVPNYQAGKDIVSGFKRTFKGEVLGEIYFKMNNSDYQAELSEARAKKPQALLVFAPGGMGVAFFKQWQTSGLKNEIKLYTVSTVDFVSLGAMGEAAVGTYWPTPFNHQTTGAVGAKFVKDYISKHKRPPSQYGAQAYDAALLIDYAVKAVKGDLSKMKEMILAMRTPKFEWTRGTVTFNVNQLPIQNWYKQTAVIKDGKPDIQTNGVVYEMRKDSFYTRCKMPY